MTPNSTPSRRDDLRSRLVYLNLDDPEAQGRVVLGSSADMNKREPGDFSGHGPSCRLPARLTPKRRRATRPHWHLVKPYITTNINRPLTGSRFWSNGLCGVGAILDSLSFNADIVMALRQTFRRDIYRNYAAFKGQ
ncbi:transesterase [Talaromyces pinophilus]|uniref:Transesterase n=1 Tax=Talaromyces pinophilus TaxID=128442 RepID=A0A6V8HC92_TALPI|nr:transesterase [Talaromyces pinophilus]